MAEKKGSLSFLMLILTVLIIIQSGVVALLVLEVFIPQRDRAAVTEEVFSFSGSAMRIDPGGDIWGFIADDGIQYLPLNFPPGVVLFSGQRVDVTAVVADLSIIRTSGIPIRIIRLTTPASDDFSLTDTRWILDSPKASDSFSSPHTGGRVTLILCQNGTFYGMGPANPYAGRYTIGGQAITFSWVEATTRSGSNKLKDTENQYLSTLRDTRSFAIRDQSLLLMDENNRTLLTYREDGVFT